MRTLSIELFLMQLKAAPCNSTCVLLLNGDVELNDQGAEGTAAERESALTDRSADAKQTLVISSRGLM